MNRSRSLTCTSSSCWVENENNYMDVFTHIKRWSIDYTNVQPCCTTEKLVFVNYRSEEPVSSNMDISTGHIVLVSIWKNILCGVVRARGDGEWRTCVFKYGHLHRTYCTGKYMGRYLIWCGQSKEGWGVKNMDISTGHIVLVSI